jgi:hypothetical protein
MFLYLFGQLPVVYTISQIDERKARTWLEKNYAGEIIKVYARSWYDKKKKRYETGDSFYHLQNDCLVLIESEFCMIMVKESGAPVVQELTSAFVPMKKIKRQTEFEIHLIAHSDGSLDLTQLEIKKTKLDIGLYYADDFAEVNRSIQQRLNKDNDKGIVLLHGIPGTGKTTYLRYLIGRLKKKVLFVPPTVAEHITDPGFINLLIENPNSVLIIEDAENIIMDRRGNNSSAVSNLLNISDGLLADCLNVQIICTFNNELSRVDPALMRKGRLIARYEFGPLNVAKAQALSDKLGFNTRIGRPMTLAEITNQHEQSYETKTYQRIGFRTATLN